MERRDTAFGGFPPIFILDKKHSDSREHSSNSTSSTTSPEPHKDKMREFSTLRGMISIKDILQVKKKAAEPLKFI